MRQGVPRTRITDAVRVLESGCWEWQRTVTSQGYGELLVSKKKTLAHRLAYELWVGEIPAGLVIDHLCRNRKCANPEHLEAVTRGVNNLRGVGAPAVHAVKTHCVHGHEFTPENTYTPTSAPHHRNCRTCRANHRRASYIKERAALGKVTKYGA